MNSRSLGLALVVLAIPAISQTPARSDAYVASGVCHVAVDVSREAELVITGDKATLSKGHAGSAVRSITCDRPMPSDVTDFLLSDIDGRGNVAVTKDPRLNHGSAIVEITDPFKGYGSYTFALYWTRAASPPDTPSAHVTNYIGGGSGEYKNGLFSVRLNGSDVRIEGKAIQVTLVTDGDSALHMTGEIVDSNSDHITAKVTGEEVTGTMTIRLQGGQLQEISMNSAGNPTSNNHEFLLHWRN